MTTRADEDVRGLDVTMHDVVAFVEVDQAIENSLGNLAEHIDANRPKVLRYAVERAGCMSDIDFTYARGLDLPAIHVFHTHDDIARVVEEGTVEGHNVRVAAVMHDLKLPNDLFPYILLCFDVDDLQPTSTSDPKSRLLLFRSHLSCHYNLRSCMHDLAYSPSIPRTELLQDD